MQNALLLLLYDLLISSKNAWILLIKEQGFSKKGVLFSESDI